MAAKKRAEVTWENDLVSGRGKLSFGAGGLPGNSLSWAARTEDKQSQEAKTTSPEELLAAAHASCYAMALSATLANNKTPPTRLDVAAVCTFDKVDGKWKVTTMELNVRGVVKGIDSSKFDELAHVAEQGCPISNAIRNNVEIRLNASLGQMVRA